MKKTVCLLFFSMLILGCNENNSCKPMLKPVTRKMVIDICVDREKLAKYGISTTGFQEQLDELTCLNNIPPCIEKLSKQMISSSSGKQYSLPELAKITLKLKQPDRTNDSNEYKVEK